MSTFFHFVKNVMNFCSLLFSCLESQSQKSQDILFLTVEKFHSFSKTVLHYTHNIHPHQTHSQPHPTSPASTPTPHTPTIVIFTLSLLCLALFYQCRQTLSTRIFFTQYFQYFSSQLYPPSRAFIVFLRFTLRFMRVFYFVCKQFA